MELKKTPLIDEHERLGAKLAPFGGWLMPIQYSGIIAEHLWTREKVSLFDICHMGEFIVRGDAAASGLNGIVTLDIGAMPLSACRYAFALNEKGGIIDDLVVYRTAEDEWMVVVNAATTDGDEAHFRKHLSRNADFQNASSEMGKLDIQGPGSLDVLRDLAGDGVAGLGYYKFGYFDVLGEKMMISRTGYTGELGYELYVSTGKVRELWSKLLSDSRVKPAGLGARDTLRLEMAYPLYGQDITSDTTPFEAGKEKFVDMKKDFIGKAALLEKGKPSRRLVNFAASSRRSPRHGYGISIGGKDAGVVTSGSFSPSLSCGIGMGYASIPCKPGDGITLKDKGAEIEAAVAEGPFYKKGTAKGRLHART